MYVIIGTSGQHFVGDITTKGGYTTTFLENTAMKFRSKADAMMHLLGLQELSLGYESAWIHRAEVIECGS